MAEGLMDRVAKRSIRATQILIDEVRGDARFVLQNEILFSILLFFVIALLFFSSPAPPSRITMLTGAPGMAYGQYGEKYKAFFEKNGFALDLVATQGSAENARRLMDASDPGQVAFVQAGTLEGVEAKDIRTLGSVFYEPLWIFYRNSLGDEPNAYAELASGRVNIGKEGSGTHALATRLLALNNLQSRRNYTSMATPDAIIALDRGQLDGVLVVDTPDSPNIKKLVKNPELKLLTFARADAYAFGLGYLQKVTLPMGALDLARNFPAKDTKLITTSAELLVKKDLHPAIQLLIMEAASEIHRDGGYFAKKGEFPSFKDSLIEPSEEAKIYYKNGSPLLLRFFPFRVAEYINRLFFYVFPIAIIIYPISIRFIRYRITRGQYKLHELNRSLRALDKEIARDFSLARQEDYFEKLQKIENAILEARLPREVLKDYFAFRKDLDYVRTRLEQKCQLNEAR